MHALRFRALPLAFALALLSSLAWADDELTEPDSEGLVSADFDGVQDSQGFYWQLDQRGAVRDSNGYLRDGLLLTVNGTAFNSGQPMQTADRKEFVLSQTMGQIHVTRRILVQPTRCAARYLEVFENRGSNPAKISAALATRFYNRGYSVLGSDGTPMTGALGKSQCGVLFHSQNQGMPSLLFLLTDDRSREKPVIANQNGQLLTATFSLTVKPHSRIALVHWIAQRNNLTPASAPQWVEEYFKHHRLISPELPADLGVAVVNFSVGGSGAPHSAGSCIQGALDIIDALGVERGPADILFPEEESQLLGRASGGPLEVETTHGKVAVPLEEVALVRGDGAGGPVRVFLRDGEILAGRLSAGGLLFTSGSGLEVRLVPERIRTLVLRTDPADGKSPAGAVGFVESHRGDRLALSAGTPPALDVVTAWGPLHVPFDQIDALQYVDAPQSGHRLFLADRSRLFVLLAGGEIALATVRHGTVRFSALDVAALERIKDGPPDPALDDDHDARFAYCRLAGEDIVAGVIDLPEVHIVSEVGETAVDPRRIRSLTPTDEEGTRASFRFELATGDVLQGWLRESSVPIRAGERVLRVPTRQLRRVRVPEGQVAPATGAGVIAVNEAAAVAALRAIHAAQQYWIKNDPDDNLLEDYWTADVYGLFACVAEAGRPVAALLEPIAKADRSPSAAPGKDFPRPFYAAAPPAKPMPYNGYYMEALVKDEEGKPYAQDADSGGKACENARKFGFRAVPVEYGKSGIHTFEINEKGQAFAIDAGEVPDGARADWQGGGDPAKAQPPWEAVK